MTTIAEVSAAEDIRRAAEALLARYASAPASETETAIAVLTLWALGAVEGGHLAPADADRVFTLLDVRLGEMDDGPELSDAVSDLILEGEHFHHWGEEWGPDAGGLRRLAFSVLTDARSV